MSADTTPARPLVERLRERAKFLRAIADSYAPGTEGRTRVDADLYDEAAQTLLDAQEKIDEIAGMVNNHT